MDFQLPYPWNLVVALAAFAIWVLVSVVMFVRTGKIKYLEDVRDMIYRKADYQETQPQEAQSFDRFVAVYRKNKQTGELEQESELLDVQKLVDSCKDVALQACFERFMPAVPTDGDIEQAELMQDDLDFLTEAFEVAEDYREKYGLGADVSVQDIFKRVQAESAALNKKIKDFQEVSKNAKTQGSEAPQAPVEEGK